MIISEAINIVRKHPLIDGESIFNLRKEVAIKSRKILFKLDPSETRMKLIKGVVSTDGILCTVIYLQVLKFLENSGIKEI